MDNYNFPFTEKIQDGLYIRVFKNTTNSEDFVWHRDKEDRIIKCEHETNWKFQIDNELPINFDKEIFIKAGVYHRIIKGDNDLTLIIKKLQNS